MNVLTDGAEESGPAKIGPFTVGTGVGEFGVVTGAVGGVEERRLAAALAAW